MMNVMIVGVGGQGTLLTSRIIGKVALAAGYDVKISEVHGMAQRGGSVVTFVRFGEQVFEPVVEEGEVDVLIAFERLEAQRYAHFLKADGVLVVNDCRIDPMTVTIGTASYPENILASLAESYRVCAIDGSAVAARLGNVRVLNSVVLGFAAPHLGFTQQDVVAQLRVTVPQKTVAVNEQALAAGYTAASDTRGVNV